VLYTIVSFVLWVLWVIGIGSLARERVGSVRLDRSFEEVGRV